MENAIDLRHLNAQQFATIGLEQMAYIKKVQLPEGVTGFGVFSADGRPVAMAPSEEMAQALIRQNELEPMLLQ
jgi:hypothetical protein